LVRGRTFPETEGTGPAKRRLDVLLWIGQLTDHDLTTLDRVEILREYLLDLNPLHCSIQFYVPDFLDVTSKTLLLRQIEFSPIAVLGGASPDVNSATAKLPSDLQLVAQTALECDADITLINDPSWFPYVEEFDEFGVLLANADVLNGTVKYLCAVTISLGHSALSRGD
jgi:hypothetical protein